MDNTTPLTAQPTRRLLLSLLIALLPLLYACTDSTDPEKFTVTFDANGGSAVATKKVEKDKKADKPADPTREGYTFQGWYKNEALTLPFDFTTETITKNITLYAKWASPAAMFTVTFEANGGSATAPQKVEKDKKAAKPEDPTKEGYLFGGWYANEDLTTVFAFDGAIIRDTTLYAKWNTAYMLTFNVDSGTAVTALAVSENGKAAKPEDPTKEGYTFGGWYTDKALRQPYSFDTPVIANLTLYARWIDETATLFTVSFNSAGGNAVEMQKIETGQSAAKPTDPTREGHTFVNWYGEEEFTTVFDFGGAITRDTTLYAQWEVNRYKVAFNRNEGTAVPDQTIAYNEKATQPDNPTREGHTFQGWYANEDLTTAFAFDGAITRDTTLYAAWEANRYKVAFNSNEGTAVPEQTITYGEKAAQPDNPTREGYLFGNWYADEALRQPYSFNAPVTADLTLYAKWIAAYMVTFEANGGTPVEALTVPENEKAANPEEPTREGYLFKGWYGDEDLTTVFGFNGAITADTTLYALWEELLIPDANFRNGLKTLIPDAFTGEQLNPNHSRVTTLTSLSLSDKQIASLEGIRYFTALTYLYCAENQLTALDVSQNTELSTLWCYSNQLTDLNVSKNTDLTNLECDSNQLTDLEVSKNTALTSLNCAENQLTALDVSQNTALTFLECADNKLTDLDMSGMRSLRDNKQSALSINAGSDGKNLLTTLKVHNNLKNAGEIREAKTNRGDEVKISVYTAAEGATDYTKTCADYNPNGNDGAGKCLDP